MKTKDPEPNGSTHSLCSIYYRFLLELNIIYIQPTFHLNFNGLKKVENVTTDMSLRSLPVMTWYNTGGKDRKTGMVSANMQQNLKTIL